MAAPEQVFGALADPRRRQILDLLLAQPRAVGELVELVGLSQPNTSKHLRVLRDTGLVRARTRGPSRVYEVRAESLRQLDDWLTPYRRLWAASLDRLEQALEEESGS